MNRLMKDRLMTCLLGLMTLLACGLLVMILWVVFQRGGGALSVDLLFSESGGFGEKGGIFYQIIGTLLLMTGAALVALPVALGCALFQNEFLGPGRMHRLLSASLYSLNAIPTILFGLVGYQVFGLLLDTGVSWLTGVLILSVMILPTVQVAVHEAMEAIPVSIRETARGLGLTPYQEIRSVVIPHAAWGMATGTLLGLARAAGETAAILFTATVFSGITLPRSVSDPVVTLQTHILVLAQEATHPAATEQAWSSALVLTGLVFVLLAASLLIRSRFRMESSV